LEKAVQFSKFMQNLKFKIQPFLVTTFTNSYHRYHTMGIPTWNLSNLE